MFITLEGPEGSGKTSHLPALAETIRQAGYRVLATREPGGTIISDQVRAVLTNLKNTSMHPRTEILLFLAARAQLVEEVIRPQLRDGVVVLCDRYIDSTLAYQGYGHGVDLQTLTSLLDFATNCLKPDLTVLLDVDVETGLQRKQAGRGEWNRLDAYPLEFHRRVRQGYLELVRAEPARWVVVDASKPRPQVQDDLQKVILERIRAFTPAAL